MAYKYLIKTWRESLITIYIFNEKSCSAIYKNQGLRSVITVSALGTFVLWWWRRVSTLDSRQNIAENATPNNNIFLALLAMYVANNTFFHSINKQFSFIVSFTLFSCAFSTPSFIVSQRNIFKLNLPLKYLLRPQISRGDRILLWWRVSFKWKIAITKPFSSRSHLGPMGSVNNIEDICFLKLYRLRKLMFVYENI